VNSRYTMNFCRKSLILISSFANSFRSHLRWAPSPISSFTEGFITFSEECLVRLIGTLGNTGTSIFQSFWDNEGCDGAPTQESIMSYLSSKQNVRKFMKFTLWDYGSVAKGYARRIKNGKVEILNTFRTLDFKNT
jgi:hypothetical protein